MNDQSKMVQPPITNWE